MMLVLKCKNGVKFSSKPPKPENLVEPELPELWKEEVLADKDSIARFWFLRCQTLEEYNKKRLYYEETFKAWKIALVESGLFRKQNPLFVPPPKDAMSMLKCIFESGKLVISKEKVHPSTKLDLNLAGPFGIVRICQNPSEFININNELIWIHDRRFRLTAFHYMERIPNLSRCIGNGYRIRLSFEEMEADTFKVVAGNSDSGTPIIRIIFRKKSEKKMISINLPSEVEPKDVNTYCYGKKNEPLLVVVDIPIPLSTTISHTSAHSNPSQSQAMVLKENNTCKLISK